MAKKTKVRIALDTSALRAASLTSGPFEALARIAEAGYVEIFLSEVAVNEFNSLPSKKLEAKEALAKTAHTLKKQLPSTEHDAISGFENSVLEQFDTFEKHAKARLKKWMERTNATVTSIAAHHGENVIKSTLTGHRHFEASRIAMISRTHSSWRQFLMWLKVASYWS
jgi:flagellar motility protein MotE (MotC chaperone)